MPSTRMFHDRKLVLTLLCLAAILLTATGSIAAPAAASITLRPTVGPPSSKVRVTGAGFDPTEEVGIAFDGTDVGSVTTDPSGSFVTTVKIPSSATPGDHTITATGQSSGFIASATFLVRMDWPMFHFDSASSGYNRYENVLNRSNVSGLTERWAFTTGWEVDSPVVSGGVVYVTSADNTLYAIDASSGANLWTFSTGSILSWSVAVAKGVVYVGTWDNKVYALNAATGGKLWSFTTGGGVAPPPVVVGSLVYVASDDFNVYALDATTGAKVWSFDTGYFVDSAPSVANGLVYVESFGSVYALNASTGAEVWTFTVEGWGFQSDSPTVVGGVVYAAADQLYALDAATGAELWTFNPVFGMEPAPAVAKGVVYVGCYNGDIYALDAITGTQKWKSRIAIGTGVYSSAAVANGVVYVGSTDGRLYAIAAATGAKLWTSPQKGAMWSSPAVVDGVIYIGSDDDNLYSFGL